MVPALRRIYQLANDLRSADGANVSLIFALALIPVAGAVGAAVDYSRANSVKVALQAAADATGLMLSKTASELNSEQIQLKANEYFRAQFQRPEAIDLVVNASYVMDGGSRMVISASTKVQANFVGLLGVPYLTVGTQTEAKWGNTRLRVALALDTTGSMSSDGKIDALKIATKSLLSQLKNAAYKDGDVYVSIIPFSKDVNVGPANYSLDWIRWDLWEAVNGRCSDRSYRTKSSCESRGKVWTADARSTWNGCITDRDMNYDVTNAAPAPATVGTLFPAEEYGSCPAQLTSLTYDWTALNAKVDELFPAGNTNQGIGLAWAYQSLTAAPFSVPAKDPIYKYQDVIVLLTDGLNTQNRYSTSQSAIDDRELIACSNVKNAGIIIYTVQVNTGGDPTQSVLQQCASSVGKFTEIKQANQLISAFNAIGTELTKLRLSQ